MAGVSPTVSMRLIAAIVSGIGRPPDACEHLLAEIGLSTSSLSDGELRVPAQRVTPLWRQILSSDGEPRIGFRIGSQLKSGGFGVVDYAARCSPTLQDFFLRVMRYRRLIGDTLDLRLLERGESMRLSFDYAVEGGDARRQMNEFLAAAFVALGREATGVAFKVERIGFRHAAADEEAPVAAWFGTPPQYGESASYLQLSRATLALALKRAEPGLLVMLDRLAQELLARLPETEDLPLRVRYAISSQLWNGECSLETVARALCMSSRSLQRRLQDCETSFNALVDNARREAALELISNPNMTVSDIAMRIGFSEPSAFDRAFRRWTGSSPGSYRRTQGARPRRHILS